MATWSEFLSAIAGAEKVTLVGPLYEGGRHTPHLPTVYVDRGANFRSAGPSPLPSVSVGDGDSVRGGPATLDEILPSDKDYSDLAFALRGLPPSVRHIYLEGFIGGRRDHELANFGEVHAFLRSRSKSALICAEFCAAEIGGSSRVVAFAAGSIELQIQGMFSVFVIANEGPVRIGGACRYPFTGVLQPLNSVGLSNEGHGLVSVESHAPCFVFLP